ncbi:8-oxo-dGTP diphosphatase MutT [Marinomonas sp. CT5]|uniref:8-oxo-dGTP diphosphatase MutT n=1 Tax=Marinomonas sp. CT5 TaxID=2066133 RepID=UPI001BAF1470|nr:8-oxo-dGTP diphosphatase MutT [Marinomonas sp. CT5]QUX96162.1 8-oxo-dGTP diphosphatase MutT [Marinomonas sp. CT5]
MLIRVAVGIILRDDAVFLGLRKSNQHQGGLWEFPGGKCEPLESVQVALARELLEECGITVVESSFFKKIAHDYGDKQVELHFYKVTDFSGEPEGSEGQEVTWAAISYLSSYDFPEANRQIVSDLMAIR